MAEVCLLHINGLLSETISVSALLPPSGQIESLFTALNGPNIGVCVCVWPEPVNVPLELTSDTSTTALPAAAQPGQWCCSLMLQHAAVTRCKHWNS